MRAGHSDDAGLVPCHQQRRETANALMKLYGKRWCIECRFRDIKDLSSAWS